ncbi:MAG: sulfite exporter TauE/SafE family protein [Porticoccaceae bacterium]|nr:sulfite exporter TauE/SafE family protein [Porticoccaceae bacterium]
MEILFLVLTGGLIGLIVGITGVGGGALMTPALLLFGFPAHIAIGTDLWFAALTKTGGLVSHHRQGHVNWTIVRNLALGSLPAAIVTGIFLSSWTDSPENYAPLLKSALGFMLILTSIALLFRTRISALYSRRQNTAADAAGGSWRLIGVGIVLGIFVTLSSVGAGAIGTAVLMIMFPYLAPKNIVGTDIAHAVPLTFIAGLVHLRLGNVDFVLLACLLAGSLPAIYLGSALSSRIPSKLMHPILASLLMLLGLKYALF